MCNCKIRPWFPDPLVVQLEANCDVCAVDPQTLTFGGKMVALTIDDPLRPRMVG